MAENQDRPTTRENIHSPLSERPTDPEVKLGARQTAAQAPRRAIRDSLDSMSLREQIADAGWKYDGHVTHGSLEEIMKVINGNDSVQSIVDRLLLIGDQCEAGGHKSRARMFRALAKSFKVRFL